MNQALICSMLLIVLTHQAEYLKNSEFNDDTCTNEYLSQEECWKSSLSDGSWVGIGYSDNQFGNFEIINSKSFNSSAPDSRAIRLTNKFDDSAQPMCIRQTIPNLPPGNYSLNFIAFVHADHPQPENESLFVNISETLTIFKKSYSFKPEGLQLQITEVFEIKNYQVNSEIKICDSSNQSYYSFAVRNIKLTKLNDDCDPAVSSSQFLLNGSCACVPHGVVNYSANCQAFTELDDNNWECSVCDQRSSALFILPTQGGYACGQVKVPGAKLYGFNRNKVDVYGRRILVPTQCESDRSWNSKVAIPSHQIPEQNRDQTAFACRAERYGVNIWNVIEDKYVPVSCLRDYNFGYTEEGQKVCISSYNYAYNPNCLTYKHISSYDSFNCTQCKQSYRKVLMGRSYPFFTNCILPSQQIQHCFVYLPHSDNSFYCQVCETAYFQIHVGNNLTGYITSMCSKFPSFYWSKQYCQLYELESINSDYLKCATCSVETYSKELCKNQQSYPDKCDGSTDEKYGIQVYVKGQMHCAVGMLIEHCADYENISNKVLTKCQVCKPGYIPTMNGLICGKRLAECSRLKNNNPFECALCINPNWQVVSGMCTCAFVNEYENGTKDCQTCKPGYTLIHVYQNTFDSWVNIYECLSPNQRLLGCRLYYKQSDLYSCATCQEGYDSTLFYNADNYIHKISGGCINKTYKTLGCYAYQSKLNSCQARCAQCQNELSLSTVNISGQLKSMCLNTSKAQIDQCQVYRDVQNQVYYCQTCNSVESVQVPVGPNPTHTSCINSQTYDSSKIKQCLYYDMEKLKKGVMQCAKCKSDNLTGPKCQTA